MKKLQVVALFAALMSAPVFASSGIEVKAGVASVKGAGDKAGLDVGLAYVIRLERFFAIMPEANFNWLSYDVAAANVSATGLTTTSTASVNLYTAPLMLNGRFYIPMGSDETPMVQPIITVGAGYGLSSYIYKNPNGAGQTETLGGLLYQATVGLKFNLGMMAEGSASSTNFIIEAGYRGGNLEKNLVKLDFGGYVIRGGVSFSF